MLIAIARLAPLRLATSSRTSLSVAGVARACIAGVRSAQQPVLVPTRCYCDSSLALNVARTRREQAFSMDTENGTAPGILRAWDFDISPEDLHARASKIMDECRKSCDKVGALQGDEITFESVLEEIAEGQRIFANERLYLDLPMYVSARKELRDASADVSAKLNEFEIEIDMRTDIFEKLLVLEKKDTSCLSPERKRFLDKLIKLRKRDGLHLAAEVREQVKQLKNEISDLEVKYMKNFNEENTVLEFTEEELRGTPEDFIKSLEMVESGKRKVTLKHPHVLPIMKMAVDPATRKKVNFAFESRCVADNVPLLEKAIFLRHKKAQLLGYPTHSDYITELLMARSAANVRRFLTELADKLQPLWAKEKKVLLELKEEECKRHGIPFDGELHAWDVAFYKNLVEERHYKVDQEKLRPYFPLEVVMKGLFGIYELLLSLKFEEVENPALWHPEARLFKVIDSETKELLGYFSMDLFPREGKYSHFCNMPLQAGCLKRDGSRQLSVVAVVCNFPKPTADKPSLLTHSDVETFFHEFGHTMHHICSKAELVMFEGTTVERDFLECPSQMLENWCWDLEGLSRMSKHHASGEPLPNDLADPLIASRLANVGQFNLRQITLSMFDLELHVKPQAETAKLLGEIQDKLLGYKPQDGTNFAANFSHLMSGYDSRYYGYLWSEVYSMDLFETRFKKEGILNPKTGMDYRKQILEAGATKDAEELLRNFLGREPRMDAFLVSKGLAPPS
ncbi:thimet oligopeptidase-like [Dermacentor variabilis]|uniref:thimet oligopeptidase-like n=1 Tax=Dermacentor variabilis TaxID=34621 RepID=UPI003F5AE2C7